MMDEADGLGADGLRVGDVKPGAPRQERKPVEIQERSPRHRRRHHDKDEAKDHFEALAKEAEVAHEVLVREGSRYRFCVHREGERVLIDVVLIDDTGAVSSLVQKDITHDDFLKWLQHIAQEEGLVFDSLF